MKIAVVGLFWTFLQNERQRKHVARLRHGRNIVQYPIVRRRGQQPQRCWLRLDSERSLRYGHFYRLMEELRQEEGDSFRNFLWMERAIIDELLHRIRSRPGARIAKQNTWYRLAIDPGLKLALTLRHLTTGDTYTPLSYDFRVNNCAISAFVSEVCTAVVEGCKDKVIPCPSTSEEGRVIAEEFAHRWNVPHSCSAVDGKHVAIKKRPHYGSLNYNYDGFFSVVLMSLVDANYHFLWVDVGGDGAMSDRQIFNKSELKECLDDGSINFPDSDPLPYDDDDTPHFLLGVMLSYLELL